MKKRNRRKDSNSPSPLTEVQLEVERRREILAVAGEEAAKATLLGRARDAVRQCAFTAGTLDRWSDETSNQLNSEFMFEQWIETWAVLKSAGVDDQVERYQPKEPIQDATHNLFLQARGGKATKKRRGINGLVDLRISLGPDRVALRSYYHDLLDHLFGVLPESSEVEELGVGLNRREGAVLDYLLSVPPPEVRSSQEIVDDLLANNRFKVGDLAPLGPDVLRRDIIPKLKKLGLVSTRMGYRFPVDAPIRSFRPMAAVPEQTSATIGPHSGGVRPDK